MWLSCRKELFGFVLLITTMLLFSAATQAAGKLAGKVLETMNSGGYTYVQIETAEGKRWVAIQKALVRKGDVIEFKQGMDMGRYTSPTLGRSFSNIIFSSGIKHIKRVVGGVAGAVGSRDAESKPGPALKIKAASGADGYTIAGLYRKKNKLNGKKVKVRGEIIRVSHYGGLTWLRLIDGTGSRRRGNRKLVVTTTDKTAKKGDIVLISGTLRADKAFGALIYEVIVEGAVIDK
ncbi:DNA-binding protein [Desulfobacterota bacterium M19]